MDVATSILPASFQAMPYATPAAVGGLVVSLFFAKKLMTSPNKNTSGLPPVPEVPGWPVIGNLLQLKEKKPYKTFLRWAETHGPIYSIRTGASTVIVLNSPEVAKEAMVTRYSSISTRKLTKSLNILTQNKSMVAVSDYDDFHKMVKRHILTNVLGPNAQKRHRHHRDVMMENLSTQFHSHADEFPGQDCNFREIFESELFAISMKEALGNDIESIYVDGLGKTLSREEVFHALVLDPMEGAIEVDWRDFFPYLKWVPNSSWEARINRMHMRREAVMKALIKQEKKRIASGQQLNCYLDYLLEEGKSLNDTQVSMLIWETIIETSDTTMVTTEWAMYELSKNPACQERLFEEIQRVCGSEKVSEDRLSQLPYLTAVFHETIRKYSPAPVIPLRYVHEDTQIGGYNVPAGSQIAVNIYGCNHDKNHWEDPEEWKPERFLDGRFDPMELHKTMAFGAGKRACAGALQAMLIACSAIGRMVQEFEWRLKQGEVANVDTLGLTTRKLDPLYVVIKPRKQ